MSTRSENGFPLVPLGKILAKSREQVEIVPHERYKQVTIRLWGQGVTLRDEVSGTEISGTKRFVVRPQQFILSRIDARNGAFGLVPNFLDGAVVSNDFPAFTPNPSRVLPAFLGWMSKTRSFVDLCRAASEGTTNRVRLKENLFLAMKIPLPPFPEQQRIVARIEELAARIEEARGLRRQAVEETEALTASAAARAFGSFADELRNQVHTLCQVRGGIQKSSKRTPGANPRRYLTVAHVQRDWINTNDERYFEVSDAELDRWRLHSGDVLVIEGNGSAEQIGRAALFKGEIEDCVHQNHVIRVRPDKARLLPEFLNAYFNSSAGRREMLERSRTTSGLFNLSVGRIKQIEVPVPSLEEQQRIVAYLDDLQAKVDSLKQKQAKTAAELDVLLPSVLDRAFKGQL